MGVTCPNCGANTAVRNNMRQDQWLCTNCMTRFTHAVGVVATKKAAARTPNAEVTAMRERAAAVLAQVNAEPEQPEAEPEQ